MIIEATRGYSNEDMRRTNKSMPVAAKHSVSLGKGHWPTSSVG